MRRPDQSQLDDLKFGLWTVKLKGLTDKQPHPDKVDMPGTTLRFVASRLLALHKGAQDLTQSDSVFELLWIDDTQRTAMIRVKREP